VQSLTIRVLIGFACATLLISSPARSGVGQEATWNPEILAADWRLIWNMEFVGQIGGRSQHVAVRFPYVYVSIGPRVVVIDASDPRAPLVVDQTAMFPDRITDIFLAGPYMYVTWSYIGYGGLRVYDISNPASPTLVADHFMPDHPVVGIHARGHYAYLLAGADIDLRILDISDPTTPVEVAVYWPAGWPNDIDVADGYAYIAGDQAGLRVIDVSDPYAPVEVGWWTPPERFRNRLGSVSISDHIAYVSDGNDLWVLDVSDPTQPRQIGYLPGIGGRIHRDGSLLFLSGWSEEQGEGMFIVDVSDPTAPHMVGVYDSPDRAEDTDTSGGYAFVADGLRGLRIVDISDPTAPVERGAYEVPAHGRDVMIQGHYAYVTDGNGLHLIDVSDPSKPVEVGFLQMPTRISGENIGALGVDVLGEYAYVTIGYGEDGHSGLRIVDVSDPTAPVEVGIYDTQAHPCDVDVAHAHATDLGSTYAYVVTDHPTGTLQIVDVSNPAAPVGISTYNLAGPGNGIQVLGDYAYVAGDGLRIIDVSNPAAPVEVSRIGRYVKDVFVRQDPVTRKILAYVVEEGLKIIDVSDPAHPTVLGATQPMVYDGLFVAGNYAYLTSQYLRGVRVFDVSNPAAPVEVGAHRTRGFARRVYVADGYAYVTEFEEALRIFRFLPTASASIPVAGGTLHSATDNTTYTFPALAFSDTVTVHHVLPVPAAISGTPSLAGINHAFVVNAVYQDTGQPAHPNRSFTVTVGYSDAEKGPAIEGTLALYRWDGTRWVREPSSMVHPEANTVTAALDRFGLWAVLGETRRMFLPVVVRRRSMNGGNR